MAAVGPSTVSPWLGAACGISDRALAVKFESL
jgi:hypothetical protein